MFCHCQRLGCYCPSQTKSLARLVCWFKQSHLDKSACQGQSSVKRVFTALLTLIGRLRMLNKGRSPSVRDRISWLAVQQNIFHLRVHSSPALNTGSGKSLEPVIVVGLSRKAPILSFPRAYQTYFWSEVVILQNRLSQIWCHWRGAEDAEFKRSHLRHMASSRTRHPM